MTNLTKAQVEWLTDHPEYCFPGPPRPGPTFRDAGTLYADGRFEAMAPMKVVRLEEGCRLVAIPVPVEGSLHSPSALAENGK